MYFWIYAMDDGTITMSRPFEDFYDCETDYVNRMTDLQDAGVWLAGLKHRGIHDAPVAAWIMTEHMQGDAHVYEM